MATLEQIQSKISKLQKQANELLASKTQAVIRQIRELMDAHGLTAADIETSGGAKANRTNSTAPLEATSKGKLPAKYRNPKTGETWSGRARPPAWIKDAKDRSKFLIEQADATEVEAPSKAVAKGKQPAKRTVPPKYRDPKTGATWTGRGLPPKWIAAAKNRNRFLIEAAAGSETEATPKAIVAATKGKAAKKSVPPKTVKPVGIKKAPAKKAVVKAPKAPAAKVASQNTPEPAQAEVAAAEATAVEA